MTWETMYDYYIWSLVPALVLFGWGAYNDIKCLYGYAAPNPRYCLTDTAAFLPVLGVLLVPILNVIVIVVAIILFFYYQLVKAFINAL